MLFSHLTEIKNRFVISNKKKYIKTLLWCTVSCKPREKIFLPKLKCFNKIKSAIISVSKRSVDSTGFLLFQPPFFQPLSIDFSIPEPSSRRPSRRRHRLHCRDALCEVWCLILFCFTRLGTHNHRKRSTLLMLNICIELRVFFLKQSEPWCSLMSSEDCVCSDPGCS